MEIQTKESGTELDLYRNLEWNKDVLRKTLFPLIKQYFEFLGEKELKEIVDIRLSIEQKAAKGGRSKLNRLEVADLREEEGRPGAEVFYIKQFSKNGSNKDISKREKRRFFGLMSPEEDPYEIEKAVLTLTTGYMPPKEYKAFMNRKLQVFPFLLSMYSPDFNERRQLLLQQIRHQSLEEKVDEEKSLCCSDIADAIYPLIILHDEMPKVLKRTAQDLGLVRVGKERYMKGLIDYLQIITNIKKLKDGEIEILKEKFCKIAKSLIDPKHEDIMITTIQRDGYPGHNLFVSNVDAGAVSYGHRGLHLGCLFGHPSVFNKFEDHEQVMENLIKRYFEIRKIFLKSDIDGEISNNSDLSIKQELLNATYAGAIFGNLRMAAAQIHYEGDWEITPYLEATKKQLGHFGYEGRKLEAELAGFPIFADHEYFRNLHGV